MRRGDNRTSCRVNSQTLSHLVREGPPLDKFRITLAGCLLLISISAMEIFGEECEGSWSHLRAIQDWSAADYGNEYFSLKKGVTLSVRTQ